MLTFSDIERLNAACLISLSCFTACSEIKMRLTRGEITDAEANLLFREALDQDRE